MKVYGKYLVMGTVNGKAGIISHARTKKDAIINLSLAGMKRISDNLWEDSASNKFFIEKNTKEYK